MKNLKKFENWIDDETEDTNRRMSELDKTSNATEPIEHTNTTIDPSRVDKLISFLDNLDDDAKISAGDVLGYLKGWVDITSPPEDEIEVF